MQTRGDPGGDRGVGGGFDKGIGAADKHLLGSCGQPGEKLGQHRMIDPPHIVTRSFCPFTGEREGKLETVAPALFEREQLVAKQNVVEGPGGEQQQHGECVTYDLRDGELWTSAARHQSRHRAYRAAIGNVPYKMTANGSAQLDVIPDYGNVVKEGRNLAIVEPLDDQLEAHPALSRGRGDRIAPLRLIAVGSGQPYVHMLSGLERERSGELEVESLDPRGKRNDGGNLWPAASASRGRYPD